MFRVFFPFSCPFVLTNNNNWHSINTERKQQTKDSLYTHAKVGKANITNKKQRTVQVCGLNIQVKMERYSEFL